LVQPDEFPEGYEAGTVNAPGIIALGNSVEYVGNIGVDNIKKKEDEMVRVLDDALRNMKHVSVYGPADCNKKTGIVLFNMEGHSCEEVCDRLSQDYGIASRGGFHCAGLAHKTIGTYDTGAVRLSIGPFNTKKEINIAIRAIYHLKNIWYNE